MKCVLATKDNYWSNHLFSRLQEDSDVDWLIVNPPCRGLENVLKSINPDWVFFFHWSDIVPKEIYENFKCVVMHTGNLPKDRGGSPIQNQIGRGVLHTKVNAIDMIDKVDAGGIYYSKGVTLQGNLFDVWMTIAETSKSVIDKCIFDNPTPVPQDNAKAKVHKRRRDNTLPLNSANLYELYRHIQMLDAEGYDPASVSLGDYTLEFSRPKLESEKILCDLTIRRKDV